MSLLLELLRGADLESTSRKSGVTGATLSEWREALLAASAHGLKIRQGDLADHRGSLHELGHRRAGDGE